MLMINLLLVEKGLIPNANKMSKEYQDEQAMIQNVSAALENCSNESLTM
jgi:hypothetical protein